MREPSTAAGHWPIWIVCLLVLVGFAQSADLRELDQDPVKKDAIGQDAIGQDAIRIDVELVVLHVTALNRRRVPVSGLGEANFQVYEDGVLQEIESFSHQAVPLTVGLVIDNSGSMRPKRTDVIAATMAFARSFKTRDELFLVNFNERVTFGLPAGMPFTDDLAQMELALSRLATEGKTALYDAVAAALEHSKKSKRDKKVLIVFSDGADNASQHDAARIITMARQSEAIIYTIGIYERADPDRNPGSLKRLAKATGGEAFLPESSKEATAICQHIARDIRSQYTIAYSPTNMKYDGKHRVIQVKGEGNDGESLSVRTRAGYYAPRRP